MNPTIETTALTKQYNDTVAVDGLNLSIPRGTIYGFLGPNGAGKTTTMEMLVSLVTPTSGNATVNGVSITDRDALREQIGYLPATPPLYDHLSAREQLHLTAKLRNIPPEDAAERIEGLLGEFEWSDAADEPTGDYSTGMRQATAFIQAILHEPPVLFLDEPTNGLDPRAARTIRDHLTALAENGTTIFLSTHILPVVEEIADDVGILYEGRLVVEDTPDALIHRRGTTEESTLEDVFLELTTDDTTTGWGGE